MSPELESLLDEHGILTGQEVLDLTGGNEALLIEYQQYWNDSVIPDLVARIKTNGTIEDARALDQHSPVS